MVAGCLVLVLGFVERQLALKKAIEYRKNETSEKNNFQPRSYGWKTLYQGHAGFGSYYCWFVGIGPLKNRYPEFIPLAGIRGY
jgi:hypothetical protein